METNTPGIQRKQRSGGDRLTGNNFGKDEGLGGTHLCLPSTWHVLVELNWASESGCPGEHYGLMWPEAGQKGILEQASGIFWGERGCLEYTDPLGPAGDQSWLLCPLLGRPCHIPKPQTPPKHCLPS